MAATLFDKIVLVTRRTRLEELIERFNTRGQAKFYISHSGGDFAEYEREHDAYQRALDQLRRDLDFGLPRQVLDRTIVPTYTFGPRELVVTLGQDGLVANVAKYALDLPIVGVNPDPARFDGVLLPFLPDAAQAAVRGVLEGKAASRAVTLAEITLDDGQRLLAFNDLFIGAKSHASARYRIIARATAEAQSSSGVLISTGAGSTGWMSSVFNMAAGVTAFTGGGRAVERAERGKRAVRSLPWDDPRLIYAVREPFISRHSAATIIAGFLGPGDEIVFESLMPSGGVIFSDGIESDFLQFNAGAVGRARTAPQHARLIVR
jgi:NAD kinase